MSDLLDHLSYSDKVVGETISRRPKPSSLSAEPESEILHKNAHVLGCNEERIEPTLTSTLTCKKLGLACRTGSHFDSALRCDPAVTHQPAEAYDPIDPRRQASRRTHRKRSKRNGNPSRGFGIGHICQRGV
jgi:hypothetical protein